MTAKCVAAHRTASHCNQGHCHQYALGRAPGRALPDGADPIFLCARKAERPMSLMSTLFSRKDDRAALRPLYAAIVTRARAPHWYEQGAVADSIDGRFDMVTAVLALVLLRMEALDMAAQSARLTEIFIEDMDGQVRQIGFGDLVVGKQIGKMMGALGGRLAAYRAGLAGEAALAEAITRNIYRGEAPDPAALAHVEAGLRALATALDETSAAALLAGALPE